MSMKGFKGTMPALITPFDREGNVDAPRFRRFLDWLVPQVAGLYVGGSYGSSRVGPALGTGIEFGHGACATRTTRRQLRSHARSPFAADRRTRAMFRCRTPLSPARG